MKPIAIVGIALLGLTAISSAAVVLAPTRASLAANDFVSWGQLGASSSTVSSPFVATSNLGMTVTGASVAGILRLDQNNGWSGNFSPGDQLLWNQNNNPLTLVFADPVSGVGFNIQRNSFGSFSGVIEAFDGSNTSLGVFSVPGSSSSNADGSAVFLGISSDLADIKSISITVPGASTGFAINELALNTMGTSAIPEPSSALATISLLVGGMMIRSRKRSA